MSDDWNSRGCLIWARDGREYIVRESGEDVKLSLAQVGTWARFTKIDDGGMIYLRRADVVGFSERGSWGEVIGTAGGTE